MKASHYNKTERLIWERETLKDEFEGELPEQIEGEGPTEYIDRVIREHPLESEPETIDHHTDNEHAPETEPVSNDYDTSGEKEAWDEYESRVNQERPAPQSEKPVGHQAEHIPDSFDKVTPETPKETEEVPEETEEETEPENPPETDFETDSETDSEIESETDSETDTEIDSEQDDDPDPEYDGSTD